MPVLLCAFLLSCASVPIPTQAPHEAPLERLPDSLLVLLPGHDAFRVDVRLEQSRGTPAQYMQLWQEGLARTLAQRTGVRFLTPAVCDTSAESCGFHVVRDTLNAERQLLVIDQLLLQAAPESGLKRTLRRFSLHRDDFHEWGWVETLYHIETDAGAVCDTVRLISRDPDPYFIGLHADRGARLMLRAARDLAGDLRKHKQESGSVEADE